MPKPVGKGRSSADSFNDPLKKRSARHVQKNSIDLPADENITRSARPIRFSNGTKPTPAAFCGPAVRRIIAVVAHEKVVAVRHRKDRRIVEAASILNIQYRVDDTIRKGFHMPSFSQIASPTGRVFEQRG